MNGLLAAAAIEGARVAVAAGWRGLIGEPQERALRRVLQGGLEGAVDEVLADASTELRNHMASLLERFLSNARVTQSILNSAAVTVPHGEIALFDHEYLVSEFEEAGFDPKTLPVEFDTFLRAVIARLSGELRAESDKPDSPLTSLLQNRVLDHLVSSHLETKEVIEVATERILDRVGQESRNVLGSNRTEARLQALPPPVRSLLEGRLEEPWTIRLVAELSNPDRVPRRSVENLHVNPPNWVLEGSPLVWAVLGEFAIAHELAPIAADLWQRAAEEGIVHADEWLVRAALTVNPTSQDRARDLMQAALEAGLGESLHAFSQAVLAADAEEVLRTADMVTADSEWIPIAVTSTKAEALVIENRMDEAIDVLSQAASSHPLSAGMAVRLSELLTLRAAQGASVDRHHDLRLAEELALQARDIRREWNGPSAPAAATAARAALARGEPRRALLITTSLDEGGEAIASELSEDSLKLEAFQALMLTGNSEQAKKLASDLKSRPLADYFAAALSAESGDREDAVATYLRLLREPDLELEQQVRIQTHLAVLALDEIPRLDDTRAKAGEEVADRIDAIRLAARGENERAIVLLRRWREVDPHSSLILADLYSQAGRIDDSVQEYRHVHASFGDVKPRFYAAELLYRHDRTPEARSEAQAALALVDQSAPEWELLHQLLIEIAWTEHRWKDGEHHARQLLKAGYRQPAVVWALTALLFNQRLLRQAWTEHQSNGAPPPKAAEEVKVWANLAIRYDPGDASISAICDLAREWLHDEDVSAHLIMLIHTRTSGKSPNEETVKIVQEVTEAFVSAYPDSRRLMRYEWSGVPDFERIVKDKLASGAKQRRELARQVYLTNQPIGLLSSVSGRGYLEVLMLGAGGVLPIEVVDAQRRDHERELAKSALNNAVVVDVSFLNTLRILGWDLWDRIRPHFSGILIPEPGAIDVHLSAESFEARSEAWIGWDPEEQRMIADTLSLDVVDRLADESGRISELVRSLDVRPVMEFRVLEDFDGPDFASWLSAVELAAQQGLPLIADDVVLRAIARVKSVSAFSSVAVLHSLQEAGELSEPEVESAIDVLRAQRAVDLSFDGTKVLKLAEDEGWVPGAAAVPFTRTALWRQEESEALETFVGILSQVSVNLPEALGGWLAAGIHGAASGRPFAEAQDVAGRFLGSVIFDFGRAHLDVIPDLVSAARNACRELGLNQRLDPLRVAVDLLWTAYQQHLDLADPSSVIQIVLGSLSQDDQLVVISRLKSLRGA